MAQNLVNALSLGSLDALIAIGIALLFSIMGLINFAHGELIMIGGYALLWFAGLPFAVAAVLVVAVVIGAALAMERLAFRSVRGRDRGDAADDVLRPQPVRPGRRRCCSRAPTRRAPTCSASLGAGVEVAGLSVGKLDIAIVGVTAVLLLGLAWFLRATPLGVQMRAAAEDFRMARALGVRANLVVAAAFGMSGAFAAIAAIFLVARTGTLTPAMGLSAGAHRLRRGRARWARPAVGGGSRRVCARPALGDAAGISARRAGRRTETPWSTSGSS